MANAILVSIDLPPTTSLTFASVVTELGTPEAVTYEVLPWQPTCLVSLIWPHIGLSTTARVHDYCPTEIPAGGAVPVSPFLGVDDLIYSDPSGAPPFETAFLSRPWGGFSHGLESLFPLIPGGPGTWLVPLLALASAALLGLARNNLKPVVVGSLLGAVAACVPTIRLQITDTVVPTCGAYTINTFIASAVLTALIEALRTMRRCHSIVQLDEEPVAGE
jgi:hypothetical protein